MSTAERSNLATQRAPLLLAALLLACALAPAPGPRAQDAPASQTKTAAPSPSPSPLASDDKSNAPARGAKAGAIKGRVVGEDGQPLQHAAVYIRNRSWGTPSRQFAPATSDEDGRFAFDELDPGLYGFYVYMPGYAAETEGQDNVSSATYRVGDDVTLRLAKGGVITGTVTSADGEPVVGVAVRVIRVRTLDNRPAPPLDLWLGNESPTDDRGVYRVYGLPAGVYLVAAGGGQRWSWSPPTPYDADAPTYFRSGTLDTAEEITVRAGQEVGGVDLRYRGERGHAVSGTFVFASGRKPDESVTVTLVHAATGTTAASVGALRDDAASANGFSIEGVGDGDYELRAMRYSSQGESASSPPQRVSVRGADVTGLRLTLVPYGSIGGDLTLEPLRAAEGACKTATRRALLPQEVIIAAPRLDRSAEQRPDAADRRRETTPTAAGSFTLRTLEPGRYRVEARPADDNWYVRDIQLPAAPAAAPANTAPPASPSPTTTRPTRDAPAADAATNTARHALDLKPGQQLDGLRVVIAEGAATLSGRLAPAVAEATLPPPARLRVHLVPAAREQADNPLRFYETTPAADYSFSLANLAPGRYLFLAREVEAADAARASVWDATARARLRRDAEAMNLPVELQPCQRETDFRSHPYWPARD